MTRRFHIDVYDRDVVVAVTPNLPKTVHKLFPEVSEKEVAAAQAVCVSGSERRAYGLIFDTEYLSCGLVAHEVFHLTVRLMSDLGVKYSVDRDEHAALLNEYLNRRVLQILKPRKI